MGQVDIQVTHMCYCGVVYDCPYCSTPGQGYICSTRNGDEDTNMCDICLKKFAESYEQFVSEEARAVVEAAESDALEYAVGLGDQLEDDYNEESRP